MADHPILFNGSMIRALLREIEAPGMGKTQTRRIIKPQPELAAPGQWDVFCAAGGWIGVAEEDVPKRSSDLIRVQSGDRLWVRETGNWRGPMKDHIGGGDIGFTFYAADSKRGRSEFFDDKNRPGMHMPRWASRLSLYVTEVRVQRLQEISEAGAIAEGILHQNVILDVKCYGGQPIEITADRYWNGTEPDEFEGFESASEAYADLWDQINGTGAWAQNPWVARYSFKPVLGNIDALPATLQEEA
ncbi:hypothetical protein [Xanthobacter sp. ZOL 2024]